MKLLRERDARKKAADFGLHVGMFERAQAARLALTAINVKACKKNPPCRRRPGPFRRLFHFSHGSPAKITIGNGAKFNYVSKKNSLKCDKYCHRLCSPEHISAHIPTLNEHYQAAAFTTWRFR
jgi:hypothetical protein